MASLPTATRGHCTYHLSVASTEPLNSLATWQSLNMNRIYGFEGEVKAKYSQNVFKLFTECFHCLPLGECIRG